MKQRSLAAWILAASIVLGCWIGCGRLPYSVEHFKQIEAAVLASEILAWEKRGAKPEELGSLQVTNSRLVRCGCQTNLTVNGVSYTTVIRLDAKAFQGAGVLLGTRRGGVLWLARNGEVTVVRGMQE